jgi:two-component system sensor histidine kinase KdpD
MSSRPDVRAWLPPDERAALIGLAGVAGALAVTTLAVAALEGWIGVADASAAYLLAVVACAVAFGSWAAVVASFGAFLLYDFFFTEPRHTLTVSDPGEWLTLLLLLAMGILVGQLAASQRSRARAAEAREREARALFRVSRALATRAGTLAVLPEIVATLRDEAGMERVWVTLGDDDTGKVVADTSTGPHPPAPRRAVLRRTPTDAPAEWVDILVPRAVGSDPDAASMAFRVKIEAAGRVLGGVSAVRPRARGLPDATSTRLISAAADQIGQALEQDRLAEEARERDLALQGDALKSALLESVSHDLRTPLASIRAAAGSLRDPDIPHPLEDTIAMGEAIDREADFLNRLVTNLLDMSRIEAGSLRAELEAYEPIDLVERTIERMRPVSDARPVEVAVPATLPPVLADAVYVDQVLANLIDNARKYVPPDRPTRITASEAPEGVVITVEDGGPGVPPSELPRLFEKFYRVAKRSGSRPGTGVGLAVVRGLVEAMGGSVAARRSDLGGLAVDVRLRRAPGTLGTTRAQAVRMA